ncbi:unnamed protein product [Calypogeia fissa]
MHKARELELVDCYLGIDLAFEAEDLFDRSLFKEGNSALIKDQPIATGAGCGGEMANSRHARNSATGAMVQQLVAMAVRVLVVLAMLQRAPLCRAQFAYYGTNPSDTSTPFRVGFYSQSCPSAESIVTQTLRNRYTVDIKAPARMMRLFFHECFITGCDGSLLVNATSTNPAPEKTATPNLSLAGFDIIDTAKAALEAVCPGVVSCADIEALMTRDAIGMLGGPSFQIPTGRLDTRAVSTASQATNGLPSPSDSAQTAAIAFSSQGFTIFDFVTLIGAHTVGAASCQTFSYRLYNYQGTGRATTSMDPGLVATLKTICPDPNNASAAVFPDPTVALDQGTINTIDNSYYQQLQQGHGILEIDQNVGMDPFTGAIVTGYAGLGSIGPTMSFTSNFASVIIKMGTLNVITGSPGGQGSIRQNCAVLN